MSKINFSKNASLESVRRLNDTPESAVKKSDKPVPAGAPEAGAPVGKSKTILDGKGDDILGVKSAEPFLKDTMSEYEPGLLTIFEPGTINRAVPGQVSEEKSASETGDFDPGSTLHALQQLKSESGQGTMGGIYGAMYSLLEQGALQKKDRMQEAAAAGQQKMSEAMSGIEDKKSEIEQKLEAARDQFVSSVCLSVAQCVSSIMSTATAGVSGSTGQPATGPALAALSKDLTSHVEQYHSQTTGAAATADKAGLSAMKQQAAKETYSAEEEKEKAMLEATKEHVGRLMDMIHEMQKIHDQSVDAAQSDSDDD